MIKVSCAIIRNETGEVLVTQRSHTMPLPLKWEFPGGKVEPSESAEQSLIREINEELTVQIRIIEKLQENVHHYPDKTICLIPFLCEIISGEIQLKEHAAFLWLKPDKLLMQPDWAEADIPIAENLQSKYGTGVPL